LPRGRRFPLCHAAYMGMPGRELKPRTQELCTRLPGASGGQRRVSDGPPSASQAHAAVIARHRVARMRSFGFAGWVERSDTHPTKKRRGMTPPSSDQ
jgi:hypothetical protein